MAYPWRFIGFLILALLAPKLYELTSVFWIGRISLEALSIADQFEFISVGMEVISEATSCGVLALVARAPNDREHVARTVRLGLRLALTGACALTVIVLLGGDHFVRTLGTPPALVTLTRRFLALRSLALPLDAAALLFLVAIKAMGRGWEALRLVAYGVLLTAALDLLLISNTPLSLHLGVPGVALSQVLGKLGLFVLTRARFYRLVGPCSGSASPSSSKLLAAIGLFGGLDSLVRNVGYLSLLALLNSLGAAPFGGYGLAMTLLWTALVPVLALSEGTSIGIGALSSERSPRAMVQLSLTSAALGLAYMGLCTVLGAAVLHPLLAALNPNPALTAYAEQTLRWLALPYLCFTLSLCIKGLFFGTGRTGYIFLISLVTNVLVIGPFVALVRGGVIAASFDRILHLLAAVMATDMLLAGLCAVHLFRRMRAPYPV